MILEAMYNGEFYPCETVVPTSPEYRRAIQTCAALMEQLSQRLSKEDYALVEELRAQNARAERSLPPLRLHRIAFRMSPGAEKPTLQPAFLRFI